MQLESFHWFSSYAFEPLYHMVIVRLSFLILFWSSFLSFGGIFNKTIILFAIVGYEMIIANSALWASLAIYHLMSNARLWNE